VAASARPRNVTALPPETQGKSIPTQPSPLNPNPQQFKSEAPLSPEYHNSSTDPLWIFGNLLPLSSIIYRPSLGAFNCFSLPFRYSRTSPIMAPTLSVPRTPGVTSPTASDDTLSRDNYFGPVTRSAARTRSSRVTSPEPTELSGSASERSETPTRRTRKRGFGSLTAQGAKLEVNGGTNGHLTVPTLPAQREISRSPSPLGLIPIHSQFRSFVSPFRAKTRSMHSSELIFHRYTAMRFLARFSMYL
jgi:hypothetical protein